MPGTLRRILPFALALGLAACVPAAAPPDVVAWAARRDGALARPAARPPVADVPKSTVRLRPRLMGNALRLEALSPGASARPLGDALYAPGQTAALRSAGMRHLSTQHLGEGRADAALGAARAAHDLALEAYGPDHVETLAALIAVADVLTATGRATEGEAVLLVASQRARTAFGPGHPASRAAARRLAVHRGLTPIGPLLRSFNRRANRLG